MRGWKPIVFTTTMLAGVMMFPGVAAAHDKGICRDVPQKGSGHACVFEGKGNYYIVSAHDTSLGDFRNTYIDWVLKNGSSPDIHDGGRNGPNKVSGYGNVVRFRACRSDPRGNPDLCSTWRRTPGS